VTIASRGNNSIASIEEWGGGDDETKKKKKERERERDILNHFKNILPILENLTSLGMQMSLSPWRNHLWL